MKSSKWAVLRNICPSSKGIVVKLDSFHSLKNVHFPSKITLSIFGEIVIKIGSFDDANTFSGEKITCA